MLVEEGRLTWDGRVTEYLPDFQLHDPYVTREITVRDLLSHRSGLPRGDRLWYGTGLSRDEILQRIRLLKPGWSFRSRFGYQNVMFLAAGRIVEVLTGVSWGEFVGQRIFDPLGMHLSNTSVRDLATHVNLATPHAEIDGKITPVPWRNIDNIAPAIAINSNAVEMAQWVRLQLNDGAFAGRQVISATSIDELRTPQTVVPKEGEWALLAPQARFLSYGLGWYLFDYRGQMVAQHGGNIDGMTAIVAMMPDLQLGVVILTNRGGTLLPVALMNWIFDLWLGHIERDWSSELFTAVEELKEQEDDRHDEIEAARVPQTSPSLPLGSYAGTYADSLFGLLEIVLEGDSLEARFGQSFVGDLEHWHYDTFRTVWRDRQLGETKMHFVLDQRGVVAEVKVDELADFKRPH
jgi:CubicO group peptidase (beta-lactamase class C family)